MCVGLFFLGFFFETVFRPGPLSPGTTGWTPWGPKESSEADPDATREARRELRVHLAQGGTVIGSVGSGLGGTFYPEFLADFI